MRGGGYPGTSSLWIIQTVLDPFLLARAGYLSEAPVQTATIRFQTPYSSITSFTIRSRLTSNNNKFILPVVYGIAYLFSLVKDPTQFFYFAVPVWATGPGGCLLTELPSLTVLYNPEQSALELTSDCGLDGTRRIACKGKAVRIQTPLHISYIPGTAEMEFPGS